MLKQLAGTPPNSFLRKADIFSLHGAMGSTNPTRRSNFDGLLSSCRWWHVVSDSILVSYFRVFLMSRR